MAARWREFEKEVATFFERAGFQVQLNPKTAHPRQTDIFAYDGKLRILLEVKDRKRPIDIGDIEDLRSRLNRTSPDVVGAIFSKSGLGRGAISEIETGRTREILTFVGTEIDMLRNGRQNIRSLVEQKRESLTVNGKVWQSSGRSSRYLNVPLPSSAVSFLIGRSSAPYFESRSELSGAPYALQIHDTGWGAADGEGARLAIRVALSDIADLRDLMGYLHKTFGLSKEGMFFIHQSESSWHGVGPQEFINAAKTWRDRYAASPSKRFHHSEQLGYYDNFHTGWIYISAQQRVGTDDPNRASFLHQAEIVIQLPGVPVDMSRFQHLCQYANNEWAHFHYISERRTASRRLKIHRKLNVIGRVVEANFGPEEAQQSPLVIAVIARNPFYRKSALPKELCLSSMLSLNSLLETELLLCNLRDWHEDSDQVDYYYLEGVEVTECGAEPILRPFGTWNGMRKTRRIGKQKLRRS
jgi:hypothetical protein